VTAQFGAITLFFSELCVSPRERKNERRKEKILGKGSMLSPMTIETNQIVFLNIINVSETKNKRVTPK